MDVIGFLCVSLGSSTVQLHDNLGSRRACACSVLEGCSTEEQRSVVRFMWVKGLNAKDIHKEIFPVYGGKCLSLKAVHNWVEEFSQGRSKVADDARPGAEVAETCCGCRRTDKTMGQVCQCWWRICREINVFPRFGCHMFYVLYPFVTCLLNLPRSTESAQICAAAASPLARQCSTHTGLQYRVHGCALLMSVPLLPTSS
jgi:hypothetical protein